MRSQFEVFSWPVRPLNNPALLPFVSVIIPTYNRVDMLPITVDSLINQTYPNERYEIIIADNNSTDRTEHIIAAYVESHNNIRAFVEKRQGVHYARNSAAKVARGEILYYTDDDMVADPSLLAEIVKPFLMDDLVASVSGKVLPKWEKQPPKWVVDLCLNGVLSLNDGQEPLIISSENPGVYSCHQAIRKSILFEAGGFNPENTRGTWVGDGETGLNIKIGQLGYKFAYISSSVTYHMIPPERMTQAYLNGRLRNQASSDSYSDFRSRTPSRMRLAVGIGLHALRAARSLVRFLLTFVSLRQSWRWHRAYIPYHVSRIKYDFRLIKDAEWRELVLKHDWFNE